MYYRPQFPFLKFRKTAFLLSGVLILVGIISLLLQGLNLGIDFTGGTVLHLDLREDYHMEEVRDVLSPFELEGAPLQRAGHNDLGEGTEVIIKAPTLEGEVREEIINSFLQRWPQMTTEDILREENVGAVIGRELTREAFTALLIAFTGMVIYITLRFESRFALAGIAALLHDAFIILTLFSLFRLEINSPFIAAILTIIGYSINDTIVVFDRIRENIGKYWHKKGREEIVNDSINENLVRSINTSLTTLAVLLSLFAAFNYFVGTIDLKVFAIALIIGVISGTYSSIFIASPLWLFLTANKEKKGKKQSPEALFPDTEMQE